MGWQVPSAQGMRPAEVLEGVWGRWGCWRGVSGRLARNKSFFQKTLEATRGVFWRVGGGLGLGAGLGWLGGGEG